VATLGIASRFGCERACGPGLHGVVVFFVHMHIFTQLGADMLVVNNFDASDQFLGINVPGDTVLGWKNVE
jgi:hypothetical protein